MAQNIFIYLFDCNCIYAHFRRILDPHKHLAATSTATATTTADSGWHLTSKALPRPDAPPSRCATPPRHQRTAPLVPWLYGQRACN
uniref:RE68437p n=1 Tax=Drosophila melanogaster TaxID=7227 RepID=Q6NNC8_DROME|nr:RE68437p [Drosophila melanogaster]